MRDVYRRMLAEWRGIPSEERFLMTVGQIGAVPGAAGRSDAD